MTHSKGKGNAQVPASFEVRVNGKRIAVMGMQGRGGISANVAAWGSGPGPKRLSMYLGGTDSSDDAWDCFYRWPAPRLRLGDEVTVKVLRPVLSDRPVFQNRYSKLGVDDLPGAENATYFGSRHVRLWADRWGIVLAASNRGSAPRLTAKAARKVAGALVRAAYHLERRNRAKARRRG